MKHHKYGGSTAKRTRKCPRWISLSEGKTRGRVGMPASEGTMMHGMFEEAMQDDQYDPAALMGLETVIDTNTVTVNEDMVRKVNDACDVMDEVLDNIDPDDKDTHYEMGHEYNADIGGTGDIVLASHEMNCFAVGDLKTGDGEMVYAEENDQLLFYAWMMLLKFRKEFDFNVDTEIVLFIIQPSERREDFYDEWVTDVARVMMFAEAFKQSVKVAESGKSDPNPGDHCKYCPAILTCPAKTGQMQAAARFNLDEIDDLITALSMVDQAEEWCREVRKIAHDQADQGVELEGWKLVNKRATRKWLDEAVTAKAFKLSRKLTMDDYMDMSLKSAPQMEKVCKAKKVDFKKFESMIHLHSSGTTLVKADDKRPAAVALEGLAGMIASIN